MTESASEVPVEAILAEGLLGTHISRHLLRFHFEGTLLELHLRFLHRVKSRVKEMKFFVRDLNIYLETLRFIENIKNNLPVVHWVHSSNVFVDSLLIILHKSSVSVLLQLI